jgi:hypothetical protein
MYCSINYRSFWISNNIFIMVSKMATDTMAWSNIYYTYQVHFYYLIYRIKEIISFFSQVLKRRLTHIWLCWVIIVPIWLFGMLAIAIRTIGLISYETFIYPLPFQIIGYILTSLAPMSILIYFIYYQCKGNR